MAISLKGEARAHRNEAKRHEWRKKGMHLTREQANGDAKLAIAAMPYVEVVLQAGIRLLVSRAASRSKYQDATT